MSAAFVIGVCVDCAADLVPNHHWRRFPASYRAALAHHGFRGHSARSLCHLCYQRRWLSDVVIDIERKTLSREDILDEWAHFTKDRETYTQNVRAFAAYLGRSFDAVEKALTRAGVDSRNWRRAAS